MTPAEYEHCKTALRRYYRQHLTIPAAAGLADLWGFGARSWAHKVAQRLKAEGFLEAAPGRRLRPGPEFFSQASTAARPDRLESVTEDWARGFPANTAEAYGLTVRISQLAAIIDDGTRRSAIKYGINSGELMVLDALHRLGSPYTISPTQIKDRLFITLAGLGKRLRRLTQLGLIERIANPDDGRSTLIRLTRQGRALLLRKSAEDRTLPNFAWAFDMPAAERAALLTALKNIQARIDGALTENEEKTE